MQFIAQSSIDNKGKRVGLLRGTTTRMALWLYVMMRVHCHKDVLKANIHTLIFRDLVKNKKVRRDVMDIENETF